MKKIYLQVSIFVCSICLSFSIEAQRILRLEDCKKLALENNLNLRNSDLEVERAEETKKEAFTKYFPDIKLSGFIFNNDKYFVSTNLSGLQVNLLKSGLTAGITAIQPIYAGGKIYYGNRLAELGKKSTELEREISRKNVLLQTEKDYWQIVVLEERQITISYLEKELENMLKMAEISLKAKTGISNDLLKVKLKIDETHAEKSKIKDVLQLSKMVLCKQMGLPMDSAAFIHIAIPDFKTIESPLKYDDSFDRSVYERPEYKLLDNGVNAGKIESKIKLSDELPSLAVGANYGYDNFMERGHMSGFLFATLSIPISDLWTNSYSMKKQKIQEQITLNKRRDEKEMLILEMQQAKNDLDDAYRKTLVARSAIEQSEENLRLNKNYLAAGAGDIAQVLEAESLFAQSKDDYINACINYFIQTRVYLQATGRSDESDPE